MDESLIGQAHVTGGTEIKDGDSILPSLQCALVRVKQVVRAHQAEAACTCLLLLMAVNLLGAIFRKSITNDEIVHIPAGYYHLVAGDFQLNNEHPPLVKMWAALPLLFIQPVEPAPPDDSNANFSARTWSFHQEFWNANRERFLTIGFWPRVMMVPVTVALGVVIFFFTRRLFGPRAAVFAVALFSLEPTILAHGRIVHTDVPAALAYLFFFFTLFRYSEAPTWRQAILLGTVTALALLTKFSMLVLAPVLLCYAIACLWKTRLNSAQRKLLLKHSVVVVVIVLFAINAAYHFQRSPISQSDQQWLQQTSQDSAATVSAGIRVLSNVVPTYFLFGVYNVAIHNKNGHPASLLGNYSNLGWWYYFPVAFALKTTLPFLLLATAAVLWSLWELFIRRRTKFLWLLLPLAIYSAFSLTGHINIGIRHILPAFPLLFILGGALLDRLLTTRYRVATAVAVVVLLAFMVIEAARSFPDYTSYMNQLASGAPHWWYLSDSNVEWGDDVGALATYLKAHGETSVRGALSGGWSTLPQYGIEFFSLPPPDKNGRDTRYVAIGASYLNGSTVLEPKNYPLSPEQRINYFDQYRHRTPEAVFGGSIYLYREH
jgi:hypothetical protein